MKWLTTARGLFVSVALVLMTGAKGGESGESYNGIISVFNAVRVSHYLAAAPLTVNKVHVAKGAKVKEGDPIVSFEHQGDKGTIRAPRPVIIDNMYVSEGQKVGADGHLFDASLSLPEHEGEGKSGDEEVATADPSIQKYLLFK